METFEKFSENIPAHFDRFFVPLNKFRLTNGSSSKPQKLSTTAEKKVNS